jgi:hypothetical protein
MPAILTTAEERDRWLENALVHAVFGATVSATSK